MHIVRRTDVRSGDAQIARACVYLSGLIFQTESILCNPAIPQSAVELSIRTLGPRWAIFDFHRLYKIRQQDTRGPA